MQVEFNLKDLDAVIEQVWAKNKKNKVWTINATMGVGKTTCIHALCKFLQVDDVISSPTFSIINEYESKMVGTIFHVDLYRLKNEQEVLDVGVEDIINSNKYCFIEWPDKANFLLPNDYANIQITLLENEKRMITF